MLCQFYREISKFGFFKYVFANKIKDGFKKLYKSARIKKLDIWDRIQ